MARVILLGGNPLDVGFDSGEFEPPEFRYCRRCRRWFNEAGDVVGYPSGQLMCHLRNKVCADKGCAGKAP